VTAATSIALSPLALTLVLSAALLHASWNALVKAATDRAVMLAAVSLMHVTAGAVLIAVAPAPAAASWPMIAASTALHYGYYALLFQAYRLGDLSQVYPISRGIAPALVAFATYLIGESLSPGGWAGLAAVSAGIVLLAFGRGAAHADPRAVAVAGLLGLTIAAYSVADGIGVRLAESPLGYMGWLFLLESPVVLVILLPRHRHRLADVPARARRRPVRGRRLRHRALRQHARADRRGLGGAGVERGHRRADRGRRLRRASLAAAAGRRGRSRRRRRPARGLGLTLRSMQLWLA
jgi:drug/metabolite transporter (DMT)-like permease